MSHEPDLATVAAELMSQRPVEPRVKSFDRRQGVSVVAQAMQQRARRRRLQNIGLAVGGVSAAAAVLIVAGWLGGRFSRETSAKACSGPHCAGATTLARTGTIAGRPFEPGQSVVAGRGRSTLIEFGPTTHIALDEATELEYRQGDRTRRFGLLRGAVHLEVAKLEAGQRFLIETADAEVEVRGTEFDVTADSGCASPRTRVDVTQGVVEVRFQGKTHFVHAGQRWPERCEVVASEADAVKVEVTPSRSRAGGAPAAVHAAPAVEAAPAQRTEVSAPTRESDLSAQNDLYSEAVNARRAGRASEAIAAFERLLTRYPNGPLAESASVGKLRLLAKVDAQRARTEARAYLSRFPRGMARAEAEALLGTP